MRTIWHDYCTCYGNTLKKGKSWYYHFTLPGSLPGKTSGHCLQGQLQHIHSVICFGIVGEQLERENFTLWPELSGCAALPVPAVELPAPCCTACASPASFPLTLKLDAGSGREDSFQGQAGHWFRQLGSGGGSAVCNCVVARAGLKRFPIRVWHHRHISFYKTECYLKISATAKASLPLPVLNWDFSSGTVYTGYFPWHAHQY